MAPGTSELRAALFEDEPTKRAPALGVSGSPEQNRRLKRSLGENEGRNPEADGSRPSLVLFG